MNSISKSISKNIPLHVSLFIFNVLGHRYSRYPIMNRQSLTTSPLFQSDQKNNKKIQSKWT